MAVDAEVSLRSHGLHGEFPPLRNSSKALSLSETEEMENVLQGQNRQALEVGHAGPVECRKNTKEQNFPWSFLVIITTYRKVSEYNRVEIELRSLN